MGDEDEGLAMPRGRWGNAEPQHRHPHGNVGFAYAHRQAPLHPGGGLGWGCLGFSV